MNNLVRIIISDNKNEIQNSLTVREISMAYKMAIISYAVYFDPQYA